VNLHIVGTPGTSALPPVARTEELTEFAFESVHRSAILHHTSESAHVLVRVDRSKHRHLVQARLLKRGWESLAVGGMHKYPCSAEDPLQRTVTERIEESGEVQVLQMPPGRLDAPLVH